MFLDPFLVETWGVYSSVNSWIAGKIQAFPLRAGRVLGQHYKKPLSCQVKDRRKSEFSGYVH